jgi:hypothetical protein
MQLLQAKGIEIKEEHWTRPLEKHIFFKKNKEIGSCLCNNT